MRYYLGLGSNLGDREANLSRCRVLLESDRINILRASRVYETEPVGRQGQPWFLNQVVEVESSLSPIDLLHKTKAIERRLGRCGASSREPRTIDIDILLAGDEVMDLPALHIPHPRLAERNFVLLPLVELAPELVHPECGKTIRELLALSRDPKKVALYR